ncbi:jasmonate O-methyltransferase-like [Prunus yedoensis var. nudiflora]|uniref:Jasmonate O-methyltransferase-like n=1 Tax=Prunus yedoensis var. nudiflora TaxID=2094558 RepID=A0A314Y5V6_PRUYE|nr:jasmonate O-methyltransferase-like [Prunus yedoensis var. nudiflora]
MRIADLGCSSGPNTLLLISEIIDVIIRAKSCSLGLQLSATTYIRVFLNDLFSNDFDDGLYFRADSARGRRESSLDYVVIREEEERDSA